MLIPIAQHVWQTKYRYNVAAGGDSSLEQTFARVAKAAASVEPVASRRRWERRFASVMNEMAFIPAGRILAGSGTGRDVTLFNCFVMGAIEDSMGSIFEHVREAALTLQQGGGIGHDFSTLRPKGAPVMGVGADASGPVSFMDVWDAMCRTIMSAGSRRGAMMGTLRCDHPDISTFITAKSDPKRLRNFNLSVLVTDAFIKAVENGRPWPLVFGGETVRTVDARELWETIMRSAYDYAEPGVIFIDRVNALNPLSYCETIHATNPCGEQPLPPYGACLLGSINLASLVVAPFTTDARIDKTRFAELVPIAVRFLDNIIDISRYPLAAQEKEAKTKRRIGLGVTGLADALIMCGENYGSESGRSLATHWMAHITNAAYSASCSLAKEKGQFPAFDNKRHVTQPFVQTLDEATRNDITHAGLRNGVLLSIAPTGTISLLAGNVSSGIEPVFDAEYSRRILAPDGSVTSEIVEDFAVRRYRESYGDGSLPPAFVNARTVTPQDHLLMQAALQPHIDASISKTVNCPEDLSFESFQDLYLNAYKLGLKGCTAYRPNEITGSVLAILPPATTPKLQATQASLPLRAPALREPGHGPPFPRDPVLSGFTYKLKWPVSDHAIYVTINDTIEGGQRRPFEIFINSKNLEHYAWTVALTRMISAIFRRGGDISFVVEELRAIFDPRGGAWMNGVYVPSLQAAIGDVILQHLRHIGFIGLEKYDATMNGNVKTALGTTAETGNQDEFFPLRKSVCRQCGSSHVIAQEGCVTCRNCGFSSCG